MIDMSMTAPIGQPLGDVLGDLSQAFQPLREPSVAPKKPHRFHLLRTSGRPRTGEERRRTQAWPLGATPGMRETKPSSLTTRQLGEGRGRRGG